MFSDKPDLEPKLIVVTAPSGSGKTTIVRHLLSEFPSLAFSVSATTRVRREQENHGRDYYFLSPQTFRTWRDDEVFIEWEEVYEGQFYGTPQFEVERLWKAGKHVVFDIDVKGAMQIKAKFGARAIVIFIKVPDLAEIKKRLKRRETETEESLARRLERIEEEMRYAERCDHVIYNDDMEEALKSAVALIKTII